MHLELWDYYSTAKEVLDGECEAKSNGVPYDLCTGASSLTWMEETAKQQMHRVSARAGVRTIIWLARGLCVVHIRVDAGKSQTKGENATSCRL